MLPRDLGRRDGGGRQAGGDGGAKHAGLPNAPFSIEHAFTPQSNVTLSTSTVTRDLVHRFFEHQMQIDGGKNDGYAAWSDAGGLAMGHYDYSQLRAVRDSPRNSCSPIIFSKAHSAVRS